MAARIALADAHLEVFRDAGPIRLPSETAAPSAADFLASWFSRSPRDRHRMVKRHLVKPYAGPSVAALEEMLTTVAGDCAAELATDCDLVRDFLEPFWLRATARMLSVPPPEQDRLAKVVGALSAVLGSSRLDARATRAVESCMQYLRALLERLFALAEPPPAVQALRQLADDPQCGGTWPAVSTLAQLLTAGFRPTVTGAALAWRALHARPTLLAAVEAGAFAVSDLVDEVVRLEPPFPFVHRFVHERCECHAAVLEPGAHVLVDLRMANRDPAVFDRPDEPGPGRDRELGLSFGYGNHRCLGPALARSQIAAALRALLSLQPPLRPVAASSGAGTDRTGHLIMVRSLPCRRGANASGSSPSTPRPARRGQLCK